MESGAKFACSTCCRTGKAGYQRREEKVEGFGGGRGDRGGRETAASLLLVSGWLVASGLYDYVGRQPPFFRSSLAVKMLSKQVTRIINRG
jgi:hypothetical protein